MCFGDGFEVRTWVVVFSFVCSDCVPIFPAHSWFLLVQNHNTKRTRAFDLDGSPYGKSLLFVHSGLDSL